MTQPRTLTYQEWLAEGKRRFGPNQRQWRFVCPSCGVETSVQEWLDAKADKAVAFSCIGRFTGGKGTLGDKQQPCNYAGGGLFQLNPVKVTEAPRQPGIEAAATPGLTEMSVFEFAAGKT